MEPQPVETTLFSLSSAPPAPDERRDGERHLTLYRVGSVLVEDRRELCLIKNISAGGMMIRAYCPIAEGTRLSVELKCGVPIHGRVSWAREASLGIAFEQPIDVIDVLSSAMDGPRPRMPRIEIDCPVTLREGANQWRVRGCDISQGGIKVRSEAMIKPGSAVVITVAGLAPMSGVVRWNDEGCTGLTFNKLVPLAVLVDWLQQQRQQLRAAG